MMRANTWRVALGAAVLLVSASGCDGADGSAQADPPAADETGETIAPDPDVDLPDPDGEPDPDPDPDADPDPEPDPIVWLTPPAGCEPASAPPADPMIVEASVAPPLGLVHFQDIALDPETGAAWAAGIPGLVGIQPTPSGQLKPFGKFPIQPPGGENPEFEHVLPLGDGVMALTSLADGHQSVEGLTLADLSAPKAGKELATLAIDDPSGLARHGDHLYVLQFTGELTVVDIEDPAAPSVVTTVDGLASPWEIVVSGDAAYVADNALGVVVLDLADPAAPLVIGTADTAAGAQDVTVADGALYAALGSTGVQSFDLADPLAPAPLTTVSYGTAIVAVSAGAGMLWAADHLGVIALDVSDPAAPLPLGVEPTKWWALDVVADGDTVFVADWKEVARIRVAPGVLAPHADPEQSELYFYSGSATRTFTIANRGGADLELTGLSVDDPRFTVSVDALSAAPGESLTVQLVYEDDGAPIDTSLCIATNDPDDPVIDVALATSSSEASVLVGEPAPDFVLPDLDGQLHSLSEHLGKPVVLAWFATW